MNCDSADPQPAGPGYAVRLQALTIGGRDLLVQSLLDDQQFHDPDGEAARLGICSASWPLFGVLWPSACVLAERMSHTDFRQRRVLEVGCGLGLASLVAQRCGAHVTASDRHPLSAAFLTGNATRNHLPPIPFLTGGWADTPVLDTRFALIIASDVLYEQQHVRLLSSYIERHAEPTTEVIVVDPGRGQQNRFARRMAEFGFAHTFEQPKARDTQAGRFAGKIHTFLRQG